MIKCSLVGNPNTGKTTLFNSLTGAHEHVGNWHGVTVEEKVGTFKFEGQEVVIADLPGIYSLTSLSYEEQVAIDYILKDRDRLIVNICDENNLQRNLYLTLCLLEAGCQCILAVNRMGKRGACKINFSSLEKELGCPIVLLQADKKKNLDPLKKAIISFKSAERKKLPYLAKFDLRKIVSMPELEKVPEKDKEFFALKLLEGDEQVAKKFGVEIHTMPDKMEEIAKTRFDFIDKVLGKNISAKHGVYGKSKLDKIFMNKFLALPLFLLMLGLAFYLTFFSIGAWLSDGLSFLLEKFVGDPLISFLTGQFGENSWIVGLTSVAIVGGLGSILAFLPQVALLFFFLSLLEDSGYLARIAFIFEDILGKIGLSGKSVYTLLMGFGCSTTAVLTARNMDDQNAKIKTGLLTPYMSCSAKFPIYSVIGGAFFGAKNIFVIMGLYLLGVVVAITLSYIFEKTILKSKGQTFILEFPPYRMMNAKRVISILLQNTLLFLSRVGTLIVAMNIIVWVLSNFSITFSYTPKSGGVSMLETFGKILAPIFIPLGFGSWGIVSALIAGLVAKEVIVSSIGMFNGVEGLAIGLSLFDPQNPVYFSSSSAVISFLVFALLYFPCLATFSVLCKEIGKKWAFIGAIIEFVVAYILAFLIYTLSLAFEVIGFAKVIIFIVAILLIIFSIFFVWKSIKKKKYCPYKNKCEKKCNHREK